MEQMTECNSNAKAKFSQWVRTIPKGVTSAMKCETFREYHNNKNKVYYTGKADGVKYSCRWDKAEGMMYVTNLGRREKKEAGL